MKEFFLICFILYCSNCCIGVAQPDSSEFTKSTLPDALENMLMLARRIQEKYVQATGAKVDKTDKFYGSILLTNFL